jgi:glucose uptake protein GlcU
MLWLLGVLGFVAVIGFVISGIMYLVAAGDEDRQQQAKRAMIYSITGVIVGLAGLVILFAAQQLLGASSQF